MRRSLLASLALVVLAALPALAHPSVIASGPVIAGQPLRLSVIVLGDEGAFDRVTVTLPVSVSLEQAAAGDKRLTVSTPDAHTATFSGLTVASGANTLLLLDVTPAVDASFAVHIRSHLTSGRDYDYPGTTVGVPPSAAGGSDRWVLPAAAGGVVLLLGGGLLLRRRGRSAA